MTDVFSKGGHVIQNGVFTENDANKAIANMYRSKRDGYITSELSNGKWVRTWKNAQGVLQKTTV